MLEVDGHATARRGGGSGGSDGPPGDLPFRPGTAGDGWRGWAGDVAVVVRRSWRTIAEILLVTMLLPVLPLSGLIADGVTVGAAISMNGKGSGITVAIATLTAPVLLVLAAGCGLVVAWGWTGAAWAAASARSGRPVGMLDALSWSWRRSRLLWGSYLAGVAVLPGSVLLVAASSVSYARCRARSRR